MRKHTSFPVSPNRCIAIQARFVRRFKSINRFISRQSLSNTPHPPLLIAKLTSLTLKTSSRESWGATHRNGFSANSVAWLVMSLSSDLSLGTNSGERTNEMRSLTLLPLFLCLCLSERSFPWHKR
jgi:hypothetical protein